MPTRSRYNILAQPSQGKKINLSGLWSMLAGSAAAHEKEPGIAIENPERANLEAMGEFGNSPLDAKLPYFIPSPIGREDFHQSTKAAADLNNLIKSHMIQSQFNTGEDVRKAGLLHQQAQKFSDEDLTKSGMALQNIVNSLPEDQATNIFPPNKEREVYLQLGSDAEDLPTTEMPKDPLQAAREYSVKFGNLATTPVNKSIIAGSPFSIQGNIGKIYNEQFLSFGRGHVNPRTGEYLEPSGTLQDEIKTPYIAGYDNVWDAATQSMKQVPIYKEKVSIIQRQTPATRGRLGPIVEPGEFGDIPKERPIDKNPSDYEPYGPPQLPPEAATTPQIQGNTLINGYQGAIPSAINTGANIAGKALSNLEPITTQARNTVSDIIGSLNDLRKGLIRGNTEAPPNFQQKRKTNPLDIPLGLPMKIGEAMSDVGTSIGSLIRPDQYMSGPEQLSKVYGKDISNFRKNVKRNFDIQEPINTDEYINTEAKTRFKDQPLTKIAKFGSPANKIFSTNPQINNSLKELNPKIRGLISANPDQITSKNNIIGKTPSIDPKLQSQVDEVLKKIMEAADTYNIDPKILMDIMFSGEKAAK